MALPVKLNVGLGPNDGTGDSRRDAFVKIQRCLDDLDVRADLAPTAEDLAGVTQDISGKLDKTGDGSGLSGVAKPSDLAGKLGTTGDASKTTAFAKSGTVPAQVARPIEAFFGDMVNLADEGALGNDLDVAVNNTAIARALARCQGSSARPILVPPGIYRANPFSIGQSGVSIRGLGEGASIFRPQGNGDFISLGTLQTITRKVGVFGIGGLYSATPSAGSSFIHVHGASQVDIDRVQWGDPTIAGSGGRHGIVVDNYGNGAQIFINRIKGVNYAGDGLSIGPLSRYVPNEIHVGQTALAAGNRGIVVYFCSGLYMMGGYASIYNMANVGVALIPGQMQVDQYPGMDTTTYPQNIYGAEFFGVNADTCGGVGWFLGGTATIGDLLMDNCIGSTCYRGVDATTTTVAINGWRNRSFKGTNCQDWGFIVNSPNAKNWSLTDSEFWCNNSANSGASGGIAVASGSTGFQIIGNKSGAGGWLGQGGPGAAAIANKQKYGILVDGSCDSFIITGNRNPGNITAAMSVPTASATKIIANNL